MNAVAIVFVAVGGYVGGIAVFLGLVYAWLWSGGYREPGARRLWRAAAVELAWAAPVQLLLPVGLLLWPRRWRRPRRTGEVPVLFVHGYAQTRADFYVMALRLRARGRGSLFALNYWPFGAVARGAGEVARAVRWVLAVTGAPRVHLVGHSVGGVVCRHYVEQMDGERHVASLVAIASPLGGTVRMGLGPGACATELYPGSRYLARVGPPERRGDVRYHAIWSRADAMVVPPVNASLHGAGPERVVADEGHLTLATSRGSADAVARWLAD